MKKRILERRAAFAIAAAIALCAQGARAEVCDSDNGGLSLAPGFCATVFADNLGHVRHMVVAPDNTLYANTWSWRYFPNSPPPAAGFLIALKDTKGSGHADVIERFGWTPRQGGAGGSGVALYNGGLYAEESDKIMRYPLEAGSIVPKRAASVVVSGLPLTGDHPMHPFVIDKEGSLFVDVGSATNACERKNRAPRSPGQTPCVEKETRAGTWKFDANKSDQSFSPAERYATGIRNGEGFAFDADGRLFVTQHGRDQLFQSWPYLFTPQQSAELPAEEIVLLEKGADYGWPECYFDHFQGKLVLAPEYGGDGKIVALCADRTPPVAAFPGHWAPNDLLIYRGTAFPDGYRGGAFIAFHGSWNRSPLPQQGYKRYLPAPLGRQDLGPLCRLRRRFRRRGQDPRKGGLPPGRIGGGARRRALCLRRRARTDLAHHLCGRRLRQGRRRAGARRFVWGLRRAAGRRPSRRRTDGAQRFPFRPDRAPSSWRWATACFTARRPTEPAPAATGRRAAAPLRGRLSRRAAGCGATGASPGLNPRSRKASSSPSNIRAPCRRSAARRSLHATSMRSPPMSGPSATRANLASDGVRAHLRRHIRRRVWERVRAGSAGVNQRIKLEALPCRFGGVRWLAYRPTAPGAASPISRSEARAPIRATPMASNSIRSTNARWIDHCTDAIKRSRNLEPKTRSFSAGRRGCIGGPMSG